MECTTVLINNIVLRVTIYLQVILVVIWQNKLNDIGIYLGTAWICNWVLCVTVEVAHFVTRTCNLITVYLTINLINFITGHMILSLQIKPGNECLVDVIIHAKCRVSLTSLQSISNGMYGSVQVAQAFCC